MGIRVDRLHILHYPEPVLRQKAQTVERINDEVHAVALRMLELMRKAPGVGLAAPQVGLGWRMFVANPTGSNEDELVMINPEIKETSKDWDECEEGCLSLPGIKGDIRRSRSITVDAFDMNGNRFEHHAEGLLARIIQHENDHLDGVLIVDRMSELDRRAHRRILRDLEKAHRS